MRANVPATALASADLSGARRGEDAIKQRSLIVWLMGLGAALWLSSRVVDMHPMFAVAVVLAVLVFAARVAPTP